MCCCCLRTGRSHGVLRVQHSGGRAAAHRHTRLRVLRRPSGSSVKKTSTPSAPGLLAQDEAYRARARSNVQAHACRHAMHNQFKASVFLPELLSKSNYIHNEKYTIHVGAIVRRSSQHLVHKIPRPQAYIPRGRRQQMHAPHVPRWALAKDMHSRSNR